MPGHISKRAVLRKMAEEDNKDRLEEQTVSLASLFMTVRGVVKLPWWSCLASAKGLGVSWVPGDLSLTRVCGVVFQPGRGFIYVPVDDPGCRITDPDTDIEAALYPWGVWARMADPLLEAAMDLTDDYGFVDRAAKLAGLRGCAFTCFEQSRGLSFFL